MNYEDAVQQIFNPAEYRSLLRSVGLDHPTAFLHSQAVFKFVPKVYDLETEMNQGHATKLVDAYGRTLNVEPVQKSG